jgi:hypothetical protein
MLVGMADHGHCIFSNVPGAGTAEVWQSAGKDNILLMKATTMLDGIYQTLEWLPNPATQGDS